ncbi:MAG: molybdenum cofactor guanylyltransferase [Bacteroidota bacterium]
MQSVNKLYGLVICGGQSSRMGMDKSLLDYYGRPQRYYVYGMLGTLCDEVFISCNKEQAKTIDNQYKTITDVPAYSGIGPMAAILSAFDQYPGTGWLVVGCDYPFITRKALNDFIKSIDRNNIAAAFYNPKENMYEPVLAWYSYPALDELKEMFGAGEYSLQRFLKKKNAGKFYPGDEKLVQSVDTAEDYERAKKIIDQPRK